MCICAWQSNCCWCVCLCVRVCLCMWDGKNLYCQLSHQRIGSSKKIIYKASAPCQQHWIASARQISGVNRSFSDGWWILPHTRRGLLVAVYRCMIFLCVIALLCTLESTHLIIVQHYPNVTLRRCPYLVCPYLVCYLYLYECVIRTYMDMHKLIYRYQHI